MEYIPVISDVFIIGLILYSIRRSNSQEKALNNHIITFTKEITGRPDFDQVADRIVKASNSLHSEVKSLNREFRRHKHEKENGSVILGI